MRASRLTEGMRRVDLLGPLKSVTHWGCCLRTSPERQGGLAGIGCLAFTVPRMTGEENVRCPWRQTATLT
ncbi:hypothetical protein NDU88_006407 [Pleurodeles waltl]|uniref:Uncharacterized protein n=1 Tax=Pleurodeles waltl TaxID=8319 RepID=A0AAV7TX31_PLEWA|nr:hypothetical protein NDU88_006407 [Pleurodeles waltl]